MGLRFALRGTSLNAWFSYGGATSAPYANVVDDPVVQSDAHSGVFGGKVINMTPTSVTKGLVFPGRLNVGAADNNGTFSVLCRILPTTTASPFAGYGACGVQSGRDATPYGFGFNCGINSAGKAYVQIANLAGSLTTYVGSTIYNSTANVPTEFMWTWNGTAAANAIKISQDGVEIESITSTNTCSNRIVNACTSIATGSISNGPNSVHCHLNELLIWDTVQSHTYSARTDFWQVGAFDATAVANKGAIGVKRLG